MKYLNKFINIFLIMTIMACSLFPAYSVNAKTLGDMKRELQAKQDEYNKKKEEKELTIEEQEKIKNNITYNENRIVALKNEMTNLTAQIVKLNKSMEEKYKEMKKVLNYYQISSNSSPYLEYIFQASSFTDFIYRASIAEQLVKYNKGLVDSYNNAIEESKKKQEEINNKQAEINQIQITLREQSLKLGDEIANMSDDMLSLEDENKLLLDNIKELQNTYKCSDDEDIEVCKDRAIKNTYIPPSTGSFLRPINNAQVTGNYGWYDPYYNGRVSWHAAMDLAGPSGSKIYAAAAGKVVSVTRSACGNNIVYIAHNINGQRYTTGYWHMRYAYVTKGELVSENSVVGIQGGRSSEDTCSSGEHLDFVLTRGAYTIDYQNNPRSISINPRTYLFFPQLIERATGVGYSNYWYVR